MSENAIVCPPDADIQKQSVLASAIRFIPLTRNEFAVRPLGRFPPEPGDQAELAAGPVDVEPGDILRAGSRAIGLPADTGRHRQALRESGSPGFRALPDAPGTSSETMPQVSSN